MSGTYASSDVKAKTALKALQGQTLTLEPAHDRLTVNDATVIAPNVQASNGITHVIDRVILPALGRRRRACPVLGANIPVASIVHMAERVRAQTLILGVVRSRERSALSRLLSSLAAALPDRIELWVGGKAAQQHLVSRLSRPVTAVPTLPDFYRQLSSRLSRS